MVNLSDVLQFIVALYHETPKSVLANERAALNKASHYYATSSLDEITADRNEFLGRWGRGRVTHCPPLFTSLEQFKAWRKHMNSALERYWNTQNPSSKSSESLLPDWKLIIDFVKDNGGINKPLPPNLQHSIGAIGRVSSRSGHKVADLDSALAQELIDGLKGSSKRSAKLGISRINDLIARQDEFPDIACLLPSQQIEIAKATPHPADKFARTSQDPIAVQLWEDFSKIVSARRGIDALGRPVPPEFSFFSVSTEKAYASTLLQAIRVLTNFGFLTGNESLRLRDICNFKMIQTFSECWNTRQINGEVKKESGSYHMLVSRLRMLAKNSGAEPEELNSIDNILKIITKFCQCKDEMSKDRELKLRKFMQDKNAQTKLFRSPEIHKKLAQKILFNWDKSTPKQRMLAIKHGISACANAILYRASPIRAGNLNALRFRGDDSNIFIQDTKCQIRIPRDLVKNRKTIDHEGDDDAAPILKWYIDFVRPKLIHEHPYGVKLCDSDFLFPSTKADRALDPTTFADHYREGNAAIGIDLSFHMARHICASIIIAEDPNAWAQAAKLLEDQISSVKNFYAIIDEKRVSDEGRAAIKAFVKRARGNKKGQYDE